MTTPAPTPPHGAPAAQDTDLDAQIAAMHAQVEEATGQRAAAPEGAASAAPGSAPAEEKTALDQELASLAEDLLTDPAQKREAAGAAGVTSAPAATARDEAKTVASTGGAESGDTLDSTLASLAETLMADPAAPVAAQHAPKSAEVEAPKSAPAAADVRASTPVTSPAPPAVSPASSAGVTPVAVDHPPRRAVVASVVGLADGVALKVFGMISGPLARRSPTVRDTVGWVGACTAFWACFLWVYIGFFHHPSAPGIRSAPLKVLAPGEKAPEAPPQPKEESHAPAKEEAKGDSGGGHH